MTFYLHQRRVVMSSPITHAQSPTMHPLVQILGCCAFTSVVGPFSQFIPTPSCNGIPPLSRCISPQSTGRQSEGTQEPSKNGRVKLNNLHVHQGSPLVPISCAASTIIPLLPKATFTPSIQSNLDLPHIRPPLTSAAITLLAKWLSSILSTYPNHLNTV